MAPLGGVRTAQGDTQVIDATGYATTRELQTPLLGELPTQKVKLVLDEVIT